MKKFLLTTSFFLFITAVSFSQSEKYIAAMKKNIAALDTSYNNPSSLLSVGNNFERIAMAEKTEWLPYYYAALCQVNYGFMEQDKTKLDGFADKATELIQKADSLAPNNSEISCIKSMIATCHLIVNPMQRWMTYGKESNEHIDKAISQDSTNPRPNYLRGQGLKYTPEQFGGGCATAKPELQKAADKFATFKPASDIHPVWGRRIIDQLLKECQ